MTLGAVATFAALCAAWRLAARSRGLGWFILAASVCSVYLLQPLSPVRRLDFWLPTLTLGLTGLVWALVTPRANQAENRRENLTAALVIILVPLVIGLTRWLGLADFTLAGLSLPRPPQPVQVAAGLGLLALIAGGASLAGTCLRPLLWPAALLLLLALFAVLKVPALALAASAALRAAGGQPAVLAAAADLRWLGYSYVAFRLIHVLRDQQAGRCAAVTLREFASYVLFFPAFVAGPIDRLERFTRDMRSPLSLGAAESAEAGRRLVTGLFKKFVLADALSRAALTPLAAAQVAGVQTEGGVWLWVMLYAYALMIFFDFSGYTDIAIGLGRLLGVRLPENFNAPYLKANLTLFWNNWHITLTQWFRAYFFNPVTRWLRRSGRAIPPLVAMLAVQVATMVLIGLWHGVTWNFVFWGLWHGLGLFAQNRWSEWVQPRLKPLLDKPQLRAWLPRALSAAGVFFTFHYVCLGWVWFALPSPELALGVFARLFGV
jgi:alginate O-acetyltransferase complex protein AlgI